MYCYSNCLRVRNNNNNNNNNNKTKKLRALAGGGVGPLPPISEKNNKYTFSSKRNL